MDPKPGSLDGVLVNDRYPIQRELGRGGFATTYLASDYAPGFPPGGGQNPAGPSRRRSVGAEEIPSGNASASRLDHPGVVGALDFGQLVVRFVVLLVAAM